MIWRPKTHEFRYRAARILSHREEEYVELPTGESFTMDEIAFVSDVREFKSLKGAEAYQKRLINEGWPAVVQVGVVLWMSHDEASAFMEQKTHEGWMYQQ